MQEVLTVNEDSKKEFYIKGISEVWTCSIEEILSIIKKGEVNRHYAKTTMNHVSSRSHTIFRLHVQSITNSFIKTSREGNQQTCNINNKVMYESAFSKNN